MKNSKKLQHQQRQILDQKLQNQTWTPKPKGGWLKFVRNSLGLSARQLAELMKSKANNITQLEINETKQSASLNSLAKAAEAMDCELVYWIQPKAPLKSFEEILEQKAFQLAQKISKGVAHSMSLEEQNVSRQVTDSQVHQLAQELKNDLDHRLFTLTLEKK